MLSQLRKKQKLTFFRFKEGFCLPKLDDSASKKFDPTIVKTLDFPVLRIKLICFIISGMQRSFLFGTKSEDIETLQTISRHKNIGVNLKKV